MHNPRDSNDDEDAGLFGRRKREDLKLLVASVGGIQHSSSTCTMTPEDIIGSATPTQDLNRYVLSVVLSAVDEPLVKVIEEIVNTKEGLINTRFGKYEVTPLFVALCKGWENVASYLISDKRTDLLAVTSTDESLLYAACGVSDFKGGCRDTNARILSLLVNTMRERYEAGTVRNILCNRRRCHEHHELNSEFSVLQAVLHSYNINDVDAFGRHVVRILVEHGALGLPPVLCSECSKTKRAAGFSVLGNAIDGEAAWFIECALGAQLFDVSCGDDGTLALVYAIKTKSSADLIHLLCESCIADPRAAQSFMDSHIPALVAVLPEFYDDKDTQSKISANLANLSRRIKTALKKKEDTHRSRFASRELAVLSKELEQAKIDLGHKDEQIAELMAIRSQLVNEGMEAAAVIHALRSRIRSMGGNCDFFFNEAKGVIRAFKDFAYKPEDIQRRMLRAATPGSGSPIIIGEECLADRARLLSERENLAMDLDKALQDLNKANAVHDLEKEHMKAEHAVEVQKLREEIERACLANSDTTPKQLPSHAIPAPGGDPVKAAIDRLTEETSLAFHAVPLDSPVGQHIDRHYGVRFVRADGFIIVPSTVHTSSIKTLYET